MANKDFVIPIKGVSKILPADLQTALTTGHMDNMFPLGALDNKFVLVQRPGMDNVFAQQIGGEAAPIVAACSVTVVD